MASAKYGAMESGTGLLMLSFLSLLSEHHMFILGLISCVIAEDRG